MGFGIDVGDSALQFVEILRSQNSIQVVQAFPFPLSEGDQTFSDETAAKLKEFLQQKEVRIRNAVVGISGKELNIRYLKVMTTSPQRIAQIVEMEMSQIREKMNMELAYQYLPLSKINLQIPGGLVALAIVHDSFLGQLTHFFQQAGISIVGFVPNSFAAYTVYSQMASLWDREMVYLVNLTSKNLDLAICYESNLHFLRNLTLGATLSSESPYAQDSDDQPAEIPQALQPTDELAPINKPSQNVENSPASPTPAIDPAAATHYAMQTANLHRIPDQLVASLKYARLQLATPDLKPTRVVIMGVQALNATVHELIEEEMHCQVSLLEFSELPVQFDPTTVPLWPQSSVTALGLGYLATLYPDIPLKMQSKSQYQREQWIHRRLFEYVGLAVAVFFAIVTAILAINNLMLYQKQLKSVEDHYQKLYDICEEVKQLTEKNQQLASKANMLQSFVIRNQQTNELLVWLQQHLPEQVYLTQLTFQQAGKQDNSLILKMKGVVEESTVDVYSVLKNFKQGLNNHPLLKIQAEKDPRPLEDGRLEFEIDLKVGESPK